MASKKKPDPDKETDPKTETLESVDQVDVTADESDPVIDTLVEDDQPEPEDTAEDVVADEPDLPEQVEIPSDPDPQPQVQTVVERRSGFGAALIGGILAAGLGFAAARTQILDPYLPVSWQAGKNDAAIATLQASMADHSAALAALQSELGAIVVPDLAPVQAQLDAIESAIAPLHAQTQAMGTKFIDLDARLAPLDSRLNDVEKRPLTDSVSQAAIAAYERELAALLQSMATQRAEVETLIESARTIKADASAMEENAAAAAQLAANLATVARLRGALDDGSSIAPMLQELTAAAVSIPQELTSAASDGVATHAALSDRFAPAARAALSAARAQGGDGGLGGFLQRHLGARSVEPREGDDPDAILSRAQAALTNGHLPQALTEISALPDVARAEMQDWVTLASTRAAALQAADTLAQSLNTN
ncbi:MAG: hypothetical protein ACI8R4_003989 [Paracoccaceae bacterium]